LLQALNKLRLHHVIGQVLAKGIERANEDVGYAVVVGN
jgi:hypothetical protein